MKERLRLWLLRKLIGDTPVCVNMTMFRPDGHRGSMVYFPRTDNFVFENNTFYYNDPRAKTTMLVPTRDADAVPFD